MEKMLKKTFLVTCFLGVHTVCKIDKDIGITDDTSYLFHLQYSCFLLTM